jgi:hypothetical protein
MNEKRYGDNKIALGEFAGLLLLLGRNQKKKKNRDNEDGPAPVLAKNHPFDQKNARIDQKTAHLHNQPPFQPKPPVSTKKITCLHHQLPFSTNHNPSSAFNFVQGGFFFSTTPDTHQGCTHHDDDAPRTAAGLGLVKLGFA